MILRHIKNTSWLLLPFILMVNSVFAQFYNDDSFKTFINYANYLNPARIASYKGVELYDLSGTHILDLESGLKPQGKHEFVFKPNFYNLSAGAYVAKLTIGDKMGTIKLVALK